jgi:hypothetical protein
LDQVARLFGPAIFESSKLKVLFLGVDKEKHPGNLPRAYTLTHSDITSKLTLAISQTINNSQVILISETHVLKIDLLILLSINWKGKPYGLDYLFSKEKRCLFTPKTCYLRKGRCGSVPN